MAAITPLKAIADYFNKDADGKSIKPVREFAAEVKALSDAEKLELAQGVCAITGDTLVSAAK